MSDIDVKQTQPQSIDLGQWRKQEAVGFVDESGNMAARPGEIHTIAGIYFPAWQLEMARRFAVELRSGVQLVDPKKRPKAYMLERDALSRFVETIRANGWILYHKRTDVTVEMPSKQQEVMEKLEADIRSLQELLRGANRYDVRPEFCIQQLRRERENNPIYFELFYWTLAHMADKFREMKLVPILSVCYDRKLAPESAELANLMTRFIFYGRFAEVGEFTAADAFGLSARTAFRCHISSDRVEPGLFLADIAAHIIGKIDRNEDDDGFYRSLYERMRVPDALQEFQDETPDVTIDGTRTTHKSKKRSG